MQTGVEANLVLKVTTAYLLHQAKIWELGVYFSWLRIRKTFKVIFLSLFIPLFFSKAVSLTPLHSPSQFLCN